MCVYMECVRVGCVCMCDVSVRYIYVCVCMASVYGLCVYMCGCYVCVSVYVSAGVSARVFFE